MLDLVFFAIEVCVLMGLRDAERKGLSILRGRRCTENKNKKKRKTFFFNIDSMIKKKTKPLLLCTEVYDSYLLHALFNSRKVLVVFFFLASL